MTWTITILTICVFLAIFLVWKEYTRPQRANLILRIIASLLAVTALACLILPISYLKDETTPDGHTAILLTRGYKPDSLIGYKNIQQLTADKLIAKSNSKVKLIRLDELRNNIPAITKLHIFGYGLNEDQLSWLDHLPVVFHPSGEPGGITSASWNQKLKAGETLTVQGKYRNDFLQPVKLVLKGLSTGLDTTTVAAKSTSEFELNTVPKNIGRAVYHLLAISGSDTLTNECLPIEVIPAKPLRIMVLSASPNFETRFLKSWLSENDFSVAVRSTISKNKYSSEYVNMQPLNVDRLSDAVLNKFDLVIGDLSVLKSESSLLEEQVTEKGLGVIIRADSIFKEGLWMQNDFPVERSISKEQLLVSMLIKGKKKPLTALKIDPTFINFKSGTQPLVNDVQTHLLVNSSQAGAGQLVFTTVNNSFNWMLAGNSNDYTAFWSLLISKATRKSPATEEWAIKHPFSLTGEPVSVTLSTSSAPGQIQIENTSVAPAQNPFMPFEWRSTYWPVIDGWHVIQQNKEQQAWWYVYKNNDWKSIRLAKTIADTRQYVSENPIFSSVTKQIHEKLRVEVPKIYLYMLLLAACTFLWIDGKMAPLISKRKNGN
jgi:hypothetical protein